MAAFLIYFNASESCSSHQFLRSFRASLFSFCFVSRLFAFPIKRDIKFGDTRHVEENTFRETVLDVEFN